MRGFFFLFPSAQHLTDAPGRLFSSSRSVVTHTATRTCAFGAHKMGLKDAWTRTPAQRHPAGWVCSWDLSSIIVISKDSKVWNQSRLLRKSNNLSLSGVLFALLDIALWGFFPSNFGSQPVFNSSDFVGVDCRSVWEIELTEL